MRVLIFPFSTGCQPGDEHYPEQILRIRKAVEVAHDYLNRGDEVTMLASSGLHNRWGIDLAESMAKEIIQEDPALESHILIGERESTNTGQNIRFSKRLLTDPRWERIITVSTGGHPGQIDRIRILMNNICPGIPLETVASEEWGPPDYRRKRQQAEKIMIFLLKFDPQARLFDLIASRRRAQARRKG